MLSLQAVTNADDSVAPSTPSPVAPSPPSLPTIINVDLCVDESFGYTACLIGNAVSCLTDCKGSGIVDLNSCDDVKTACNIFTCCTACESTGKEFGNCLSKGFGCDMDCGTFAPVAPSAPSPAPIPVDLCIDETFFHSSCLVTNFFSCLADCAGSDNVNLISCDDVLSACTSFTCCTACENTGKELGNCLSQLLECGTGCGPVVSIEPSTPSPVAPSPPSLPTIINVDLCVDESFGYTACLIGNLASCLSDCDISKVDFNSCDDVETACTIYASCCTACEDEGKEFGNCLSTNVFGCEMDCEAVTPVEPSTPSPVAPSVSIIPTTIAPATSAPAGLTAPPVTSAPIDPNAPSATPTPAPVESSIAPTASVAPTATSSPTTSGASSKSIVSSGLLGVFGFAVYKFIC